MSLGRVWIESWREMGLEEVFGMVVKHLGLRMAVIVVMVPAISVAGVLVFVFRVEVR